MGAARDGLLGSRGKEFAIAFAAGAAALLASFVNFLNHNSYPYFRPEVGLIVLGMLAVTAIMAAWYVPQRQWGRSLFEGLLAALFVDLNSDFIWPIIVAGLVVAGVTAWRKISLLMPMAIMATVISATTIAGVGGRPQWIETTQGDAKGQNAANKPAIVHIILDEHLGLEGMRNEGAKGQALSDELRSFYLRAGFAVYGGAYSQHHHSAYSIPFILNYGNSLSRHASRKGVEAGQTEHLRLLAGLGYRLKVMQSDFADVCSGARFSECDTYDSASPWPTLKVPMSTMRRAELVTQKLLKLSDIFRLLWRGYNSVIPSLYRVGLQPPFFNSSPAQSSSVASLQALQLFTKELESARPGEAYFGHFIVPHHPYAFRRDCSVRERPWNGLNTRATFETKQMEYYEQARCATRKVEAILGALSRSPAGANSIVIIHGDHGSRLARHDLPLATPDELTDADLIAFYSTLFVVRGPGIATGYSARPQAAASLLKQFADSEFKLAPPGDQRMGPLYLAGPEMEPRGTIRFPRAWTERLDRPVKGQ